MTDRWKIVVLIILVLISLVFAFFAGLVVGQFQTIDKRVSASESPVASSASTGELLNGEDSDSAPGNEPPKTKDAPSPASTNQGSKTTGSASLPDTEREQKKSTVSDNKSNPYIKTTLSAFIATEQKKQKISAARLAERQKKAHSEKDAITNPQKTQALYTLSSVNSIETKNAGLLLKKFTEAGLSPYIIDADGTNSKVIMRVGEYASRLDAERDLSKLPNLKGISFIVLRVASIH